MTAIEQVWRHLLVAAGKGQRRWSSVTALSDELRLPGSTVHQSLARPAEIGVVSIRPAGGLRLLDHGRLLMLWAGRRRLAGDVARRFTVAAPAAEVEQSITNPDAILGGFGAVVAHLGVNTIADYTTVLVYGEPGVRLELEQPLAERRAGTEVVVVRPDSLLARYGTVTPVAQAWVDLFNLPGWQAARFVHELLPRLVSEDGVLLPA